MNPNLCAHEDGPASRLPIFGSRLMLCRICWVVIDPPPPPAGPPIPVPARLERPVVKPALTELIPLKPPAAATTEVDEAFEVPLPRRRLMSMAFLPRIKFLSALIILPFAIFGILHYLMYFPSFEEYTDPSKQYSVMFPDSPIWAGSSAGSDGEVTRHCLGSTEVYRVHVSHLHHLPFGHIQNPNTRSLAISEYLAKSNHSQMRMYTDPASTALEYRGWVTGRDMVVGRIVVVNDLVYELTIRGEKLSLSDWRVRRFFDSFRLQTPLFVPTFSSQPLPPNKPAEEQQK